MITITKKEKSEPDNIQLPATLTVKFPTMRIAHSVISFPSNIREPPTFTIMESSFTPRAAFFVYKQ